VKPRSKRSATGPHAGRSTTSRLAMRSSEPTPSITPSPASGDALPAAAAPPSPPAAPESAAAESGVFSLRAAHDIVVVVNGVERRARVIPRMLLADLLREDLGLTGTHLGCEHGACGACTVLVDGEPTRSCLVFAVQVDGSRVDTVEGLAGEDGRLHPLQEAFRTRHALQCGFCTPGILMTLASYLAHSPAPSDREVREALSGNLCRCTGYQNIVAAALDAAAVLRSEPPRPVATTLGNHA
jgi:aerobic carbon-monoxide dehydrogenase small subunit